MTHSIKVEMSRCRYKLLVPPRILVSIARENLECIT